MNKEFIMKLFDGSEDLPAGLESETLLYLVARARVAKAKGDALSEKLRELRTLTGQTQRALLELEGQMSGYMADVEEWVSRPESPAEPHTDAESIVEGAIQ